MSIFEVCGFEVEPLDKDTYISTLTQCLKSGIPSTVTTKDVELAAQLEAKINAGEEVEPVDGGDTGTTPLHRICETLEPQPSELKLEIAHDMIDILFQYGANWIMLNDDNETAGCIALRRGLPSSLYDKFVAAGVRSEVLLHKLTEDQDQDLDIEEEDQDQDLDVEEKDIKTQNLDDKSVESKQNSAGDTATSQKAYLESDLDYSESKLITRQKKDGVMMAWEKPIMEKSADLLLSTREEGEGGVVLNIGFGMGIIDTLLQKAKPRHHYISEAHPDVLAKMRQDGWYDLPNVTVLEGRWQDSVPKLITQGVYFDGIYYDTFSEHYTDLIDFCDNVVGLLSPTGVFSYFNGLGADRQICYDVYCQVAEMEMGEYGLKVEFETMKIQDDDDQQIRHKYWALSEYKLPKVRFLEM